MKRSKKIRNLILAALTATLCGSAALTVYGSDPVPVKAAEETAAPAAPEEKPALPVAGERILFGRTYTLKGLTEGGAGIYTAPEDDRARDYVIQALDEAGIDDTMTDLDKIQAVNDYLCKKLSYADYAAAEGFSYKEDWAPFTDYCLLSDQAVCAGYAEAFQSMLIFCGIECWYVTGYIYQDGDTEGVYHAWNRVVVDGKDLYIDTCWNDSSHDAYYLSENGWADHEIQAQDEIYRISGQAFPMPGYANDQI